MDIAFCLHLCEFSGLWFTQNLPVSKICFWSLHRLYEIFRDEDVAAKCEEQCDMDYVGCTLSCQNSNCLNECGRVLNDCLNDCPCNSNCPDGCNGCSNPICVCGENPTSQNKDNLKQCMKDKSINLGQCIIDCRNNQSCEQSCVTSFKDQYDQCPCQVRRIFCQLWIIWILFLDWLSVWMPVWFIQLSTGQEISIGDRSKNIPVLIKSGGKFDLKVPLLLYY